MGPLLPLAIKGGLALGSTLLGSLFSKSKQSQAEKDSLANAAQARKIGMETARGALTNSQNLLGTATRGYQTGANYWTGILSGNRGQMTSTMAPEIQRIGEGYTTAAKTSAELNPRGGPSASFLSELPFQQQRDVTTLLQQARPEAAKQLGQVSQAAGGTGSALLSNAIQSLYQSTAAGRDILNSEEVRRKAEAERGKSIGTGIFDLISKYGFPAIDQYFKGKGGGGLLGMNLDTGGGVNPDLG